MKRLSRLSPLLLAVVALLAWPVRPQTKPSHNITLTWAAVPGGVAYNVYRVTTSGAELNSSANQIATHINVLTFVDITGVGGTKYFYEVTAVDASGVEGLASNEFTGTFLGQLPAPVLQGVVN
jgi:fibronectin type 3 domain-containing protein